jgi:hypothetical protein
MQSSCLIGWMRSLSNKFCRFQVRALLPGGQVAVLPFK